MLVFMWQKLKVRRGVTIGSSGHNNEAQLHWGINVVPNQVENIR